MQILGDVMARLIPINRHNSRPTGHNVDNDVLDQQLIDIASVANNRDKRAFERLFRAFVPMIRAFSLKAYPGASLMADEVAQEVMIKVWDKAHTYRPEVAALSTWLFTLARNARIDYLRRNGKHVSLIDPEPIWAQLEDETADLFQIEQQRGFEEQVKNALSLLPNEQRQVLSQVYLEGMTQQEVSDKFGIPLGTVKSRVRLALKSLSIEVKGSPL